MTGKDLPRQRAGKPIRARTINSFAGLVADLTRAAGPSGSGLASDRRQPRRPTGFHARLSGSSSPYSFAEVYGKMVAGALTWVAMPHGRAGTSNAYEDNHVAGIGSKVAWIEPAIGGVDVWRFHFNRKGPTCNPTSTTLTLNVTGCQGLALPGATVDVFKGATLVASGTTDGSGHFSCGITSPGSHSYTVTFPSLATVTAGWTAFCGFGFSANVSMVAPSGYACCGNDAAFPTTMFLTTSAGTATLTYNGVGSWVGSLTMSFAGAVVGDGHNPCEIDCTSAPSARDLPVDFRLACGIGLGVGWWTFFGGDAPSCDYPQCTPFDPSGCTAGGSPAETGTSVLPWTTSGGVLPQTFTIPSTDSTGTCATPVSGSAVLSS